MIPNESLAVSVILPAINETVSLQETVERIEETNGADILEYLVVMCGKTTPLCREVAGKLATRYGGKVVLLEQKLPFLGGAVRDAIDAARGTHAILMATDLETDPATVPLLIDGARQHPESIVTATRWAKGMRFEGYNPVKLVLNKIFQLLMAGIYGVKLSDMTYGFRIFPTALLKSIRWEELKHPFLLETVVKPLRLGVEVLEVPSSWRARTEGESQNTFFANFVYFRTALKNRFTPRSDILKPSV